MQVHSKRGRLRRLLPLIAEWRDMGATWNEVRAELAEVHGIEFATAAACREGVKDARIWVSKRNARQVKDKSKGNARVLEDKAHTQDAQVKEVKATTEPLQPSPYGGGRRASKFDEKW